jgi:VWFA-related protein
MTRATLYGLLFAVSALAQDAHELQARGVQLIDSKPGEAVKLLQQALRLDAELPGLRYQLGLAYHATGDEADAELELREAVGRTPDSPAAHNYLGIVLFQLGDAKSALVEFRTAVQLAPKDPNAHFNLGEALARTGASADAVEELRIAAGLTPDDHSLARLLKTVETAIAPESTIKVEVRQVLVPTVVTDREGHHVKGLTQADFKVFEDGAEQNIIGFSVESSEAGVAPKEVPASSSTPAPAAVSASPAVKRTYLICIDTLHTSFHDFVSAREALVKLFREEHSGDSQYVVVALGASAEMVLNVTHDPSAVLAVFESKRMQKIFLDGQLGGLNAEMERFRRDLTQTREACDLVGQDKVYQPKCESGMVRVNMASTQIAELERTLTAGFLREFRALILQLARARDRRTVILLSDGFGIEPGREAYALVDAYFPFASHCLVPRSVNCPHSGIMTGVRMQDEFEPILKLAAKSNITIDTIDSRGLYGQSSFDASNAGSPVTIDGAVGRADRTASTARGNTLAEIAEATGGIAFHDSNNLLDGLERAFADARDYYTIAYVSGNTNLDGKFRSIKVQVRDPKATVNAKRGYWAAQ